MLQMLICLGSGGLGDQGPQLWQALAEEASRGDVIRVAVGVEHRPQGQAQVLGKLMEDPWNQSLLEVDHPI